MKTLSHDNKMADVPPPILNWTDIPTTSKFKFDFLCDAFQKKYNSKPDFIARAPGRVNLIGEHIDYCGYGVLPMAVEQDIIIAVSQNNEGLLRLSNTQSKYCDFQCSITDFEINKVKPDWFNYFLCGLKGMTEFLQLSKPVGMNCIVDGQIPSNAGLSSSSALVCCAALATMQANKQSKSKKEIADMCASCERYIGTQGGGMDQAISFMALPGKAKKIDFNPLREADVKLPDDVTFVISNSCVEKNKAATSDFNTRVVECRLAAQVIAQKKGLHWQNFKRLAEVQKHLNVPLSGMDAIVKEILHSEEYTKEEVCGILGVSADELAQTSLSSNTLHVETFRLHQRAMHVYSEARRVEEFYHMCNSAHTVAIDKLGELMNASHDSCSKQYQCSCMELDELVDICIKSGAIGSRLTGAGWGGCAVSMVPSNRLTQFLDNVQQHYYSPRGLCDRINEVLFATQPGAGAAVYLVK